jgi:hypothetical protein
MPPLEIRTVDGPMELVISFGAIIDIVVIVGIIGFAITAYNDRKKAR